MSPQHFDHCDDEYLRNIVLHKSTDNAKRKFWSLQKRKDLLKKEKNATMRFEQVQRFCFSGNNILGLGAL